MAVHRRRGIGLPSSRLAMPDSCTPVSRRRFCAGACQAASAATLASLVSACGGSSPVSPTPTPGGGGGGGNGGGGGGGNGGGSGPSPLGRLMGTFTGANVRVNTAGSALETVGGAVLVESIAGVFLVARTDANAFVAIEAVCTHEGCTITGVEGTIYVCPCHGSRYDRSGRVVAGPARSSLRQYATSAADGIVTIAL
jgi:Rieske Fe-S protein